MMHLLRLLMSWSVRRVLLFVLLVAAMVAAVQIRNAYQRLPELNREIEALERQQGLIEAEVGRRRAQAEAGLRALERLEEPMLRRRLGEVRAEIAARRDSGAGSLGLALGAASGDGDAVARELAGRFRLQLLRREEAVIVARLESIGRGGQVNGLVARVGALDSRIRALERSIAETERRFPLLARIERMPAAGRIEGPWRELRSRRQALAAARAERQRLVAAYRAARAAFDRAGLAYRQSQAALRALPAPTAELRARIEEKRAQLAGHWANRAWRAVKPVLGWAAWVMLLILAVPPAVKALWYFAVAPLASGLRPIRIGRPGDGGGISWAGERLAGEGPRTGSAVSWRLRLRPGEELLVRPEYLQSSVVGAQADSQLLLSPSLPFGSLATGLVGLTRIRPDRETSATLSASRDPIDEIGILEIPEGSAVVFRPRNLVGIVRDRGRPLRLERVWRMGCLMSWLTLRLRHLVFHGPCALVVKGARGVALEPAGGRRVADAATISWSAGLEYSVTRSETFLAYLTGKQSLFHDRFEGSSGEVVYEEMPRARGKSGLFGRGLEGLGDGLLKIAGL